jgi:hypothetical protein
LKAVFLWENTLVDSISVFPPGYRITDALDNPISGATIEFYEAGTSDALEVFSNSGLSTSLGAIVYCDSSGSPVASSGSSTLVAVYVGTAAYKVVIKDGDGATVETKDNLAGAINTAPFTAAATAIPEYSVESKTADYTVLTTDQGKVFNVNPTGGTVTITLPSAVSAGDGWAVIIRHLGSANKVILQTVSSQTISAPLAGGATAAFELVSYGETMTLVSDGVDWHPIGVEQGLKLGSGHHSEVYDNGTMTGGTLTPDPEESNFQTVTNGGAFTLAVPDESTNMVLLMTNNASAGAVDVSAFTKSSGDSIATTDTYKYLISITVIGSVSRVFVEALQ